MRLPRPRFTVRGLMIAVAIMTLPFAAIAWQRRLDAVAKHLKAVAKSHEDESWSCLDRFYSMFPPPGPGADCGVDAFHERKSTTAEQRQRELEEACGGRDTAKYRLYTLSDYHRDLAVKYYRAARSPWLPVEPDPPEPD